MKPKITKPYPRKILSFLILIFCLTHLQAKDVIVEGFYVNLKGDTIRSKFSLPLSNVKRNKESKNKKNTDDLYTSYIKDWFPDLKKIQWKISVVDEFNKKNELLPSQCSSFQFTHKTDSFKFISYPNTFFSAKNNPLYSYYPDSIFLQEVINGNICLYQYFESEQRLMSYGSIPIYYNKLKYALKKKEENSVHSYSKRFFANEMKKLVSDAPSVLTKIEMGIYKESDIVEIIKDYNVSYLKK